MAGIDRLKHIVLLMVENRSSGNGIGIGLGPNSASF